MVSADLPEICRRNVRRRPITCDRSRSVPALPNRSRDHPNHPADVRRILYVETASLRIRTQALAHRSVVRRPGRRFLSRLTFVLFILFVSSPLAELSADIPWPEAKVRLAQENEKLARRPQGHADTYFVICTLY